MSNSIDIVRSMFAAFKAKDYATMKGFLASNFSATGPLGETTNTDQFIEGLKRISSMVTDVQVQHIWVDGNDVAGFVEVHTNRTEKPISMVKWFHVENGKVVSAKVVFDPRPLLMTASIFNPLH